VSIACAPALLCARAERVPPRPRLGGDLVPLPANLVRDRLFTALDADELVDDCPGLQSVRKAGFQAGHVAIDLLLEVRSAARLAAAAA
jgi:hypothetical protein